MRTILVAAVAGAVMFVFAGPAAAHTFWGNTSKERDHIVDRAEARLGAGYCWGGTRGCYDCSGLTYRVFYDHGARMAHSAADQFRARHRPGWKTVWRRKNLEPGDLVFFKDTYKWGISHVGIYIGNHRFIDASDGVERDSLRNPYYRRHFKAGVRPKALRFPAYR